MLGFKADRIFWISVTFLANEHHHFHRGSVSLWPWKPRLNPTVTVSPASLFRPLSLSRLFPTWLPQADVGCLSLFRLSLWHTDLLNVHCGWRATLARSFSPELVCQIETRCKCETFSVKLDRIFLIENVHVFIVICYIILWREFVKQAALFFYFRVNLRFYCILNMFFIAVLMFQWTLLKYLYFKKVPSSFMRSWQCVQLCVIELTFWIVCVYSDL